MVMVAVRGGCLCGWVGGLWEGGAILFLTKQRGVRTNFFVLEGGTV